MLPADIIGVSIYERDSGSFKFHPGPIFAQVILADEVNRATPKTQIGAARGDGRAPGHRRRRDAPLPEPFFVIATQNPSDQVGTFPLPESQLDRFLMRIELGYPDRDAERALLAGADRRDLLAALGPCMTPAELVALQAEAQQRARRAGAARLRAGDRRAHAPLAASSPPACRRAPRSRCCTAARAWALIEGRDKVIPEDVQAVLPGVAGHRLRPAHDAAQRIDLRRMLLSAVPIP